MRLRFVTAIATAALSVATLAQAQTPATPPAAADQTQTSAPQATVNQTQTPAPQTTVDQTQTSVTAPQAAVDQSQASVSAPQAAGDQAQTPAPAPAPPAATPTAKPKASDPFAFGDFTWLTGNPRTTESPLDSKVFTGEFRADTNYTYSFNKPQDDTIGGSSEIFRSGEIQVTQLGIGGDFHYDNVRGRLMTQFGMYSETTPRNDASPARGQWNLADAYRYVSEAYGGYHWDKMHGINVDAGIFMSYIGLDSYYQFDNWVYQPSYVSSNTPWFFNGLRIQFFPTDKLKIEPWIINGWQSYGRFNNSLGFGGQILYRPTGSLSYVFNNYYGADTLGVPARKRFHTDDSIQVKYFDNKNATGIDKAAFTVTIDAGCESGGGSHLPRRKRGNALPELPRFHAVQPLVVRQGPSGGHRRRRRDLESGTVSRVATAD